MLPRKLGLGAPLHTPRNPKNPKSLGNTGGNQNFAPSQVGQVMPYVYRNRAHVSLQINDFNLSIGHHNVFGVPIKMFFSVPPVSMLFFGGDFGGDDIRATPGLFGEVVFGAGLLRARRSRSCRRSYSD